MKQVLCFLHGHKTECIGNPLTLRISDYMHIVLNILNWNWSHLVNYKAAVWHPRGQFPVHLLVCWTMLLLQKKAILVKLVALFMLCICASAKDLQSWKVHFYRQLLFKAHLPFGNFFNWWCCWTDVSVPYKVFQYAWVNFHMFLINN